MRAAARVRDQDVGDTREDDGEREDGFCDVGDTTISTILTVNVAAARETLSDLRRCGRRRQMGHLHGDKKPLCVHAPKRFLSSHQRLFYHQPMFACVSRKMKRKILASGHDPFSFCVVASCVDDYNSGLQ